MRIRVLIIDDEPAIVELIKDGLPSAEFIVQGTGDPDKGLETLERTQPDLLLLDWNLPGKSGLDICRAIRKNEQTSKIPVIMLTVLDKTPSKIAALDTGADDYLTKPFDVAELASRIKAVLRRLQSGTVPSAVLKRGCLEIDGAGYHAAVDGKPVNLSTTEFEILYLLAARENRPLTRELLLDHTCPETTETLRTIDVHIRHLRQKLGDVAGEYIKTVHRVGYMFSVKP